jgi:hypothetical protein
MQSITFPQIYCRHPRPSAPIIALVIGLDGLLPESAQILSGQFFAKAEIGFGIGSWLAGCPGVGGSCAGREAIPSSELPHAFRLIIHGGSKEDDAFDLGKLLDRSQVAEEHTRAPDQAPKEPFGR